MDEKEKMESHLSSAAAFVEGGLQEACDDACSICLEAFSDSDPSTVTGCRHEFHLHCILEWCQRSSQCPMCWQPVSLKDPTSHELLEAVEQERSFRFNQSRNATIFHHPTLGDFEVQHLPVGTSDAELEEQIIQHLAVATAMGRAHHMSRQEGHRRSGAQGHPQFLVFSTHPSAPSVGPIFGSDQRGENHLPSINAPAGPFIPLHAGEETMHQVSHVSSSEIHVPSTPQSGVMSASRTGHFNNWNSAGQSTPITQDRGGSFDFQSFSESLKTRLNAVSMRCKESITKSTRGWKERLFSRNSSVADLGSEVRREVQAGIATVSHMMDHADTRENNSTSGPLVQSMEGHSTTEPRNLRVVVGQTEDTPSASNPSAPCAASSGSN